MRFLKQIRLLLVLIFFVLCIIAVAILSRYSSTFRNIITSEWSWTALGSLATSISVIVAVKIYRNQDKREAQQKTYEAICELKENVYETERMIGRLKPKDIERLIKSRTSSVENKSMRKMCCKWEKITKYLTKLEHFSTCVNSGIFDINTVKKMSGDYLIKQYNILKPIIEYKEMENAGRDTYLQFYNMIQKLKLTQ